MAYCAHVRNGESCITGQVGYTWPRKLGDTVRYNSIALVLKSNLIERSFSTSSSYHGRHYLSQKVQYRVLTTDPTRRLAYESKLHGFGHSEPGLAGDERDAHIGTTHADREAGHCARRARVTICAYAKHAWLRSGSYKLRMQDSVLRSFISNYNRDSDGRIIRIR